MEFVDIIDPKTAITVELMLKPYKRGAEITRDVCYDVLKGTNYRRNIRDMLACIAKLPPEKRDGLKDVVIATFCNREQPDDVQALGRELASAGRYEHDFAVAKTTLLEGAYLSSSVQRQAGFVIKGGELDLERNFVDYDFSGYEFLTLRTRRTVNLSRAKNLPPKIDARMCPEVNFSWCRMEQVKDIRLGENSDVYFSCAKKLPEVLDVSMCKSVHFNHCSLKGVKKLVLKNTEQGFYAKLPDIPEECDLVYKDRQKEPIEEVTENNVVSFGKGGR